EKDGLQVKVVDLLDQTTSNLDNEFPGASKIKGELLHTLGRTYDGLGLYDRAAELLARALSVRQAALGPDDPETLLSRYGLAVVYMESNRVNDATPQFEEALKLRKARLGLYHRDTLESMFGLSWAYILNGGENGQHRAGEECHTRLQAIRRPGHCRFPAFASPGSAAGPRRRRFASRSW